MKDELFEEWCQNYELVLDTFDKHSIFEINEQKYLLIDSDKDELFDEDFNIRFSHKESDILESQHIDFIVFRFGSKFYYSTPFDIILEPFLYLGRSPNITFSDLNIPYLGVHGEYELGNGSRLYKDWCKKAKWLNISTLGICELDTLGGVVSFQESCKSNGIKPIIGETLTFYYSSQKFKLIIFAKNEYGFEILLGLNNRKEREVNYTQLLELLDDNVIVIFSNENNIVDNNCELLFFVKNSIKTELYYQVDLVQWDGDTMDKQVLTSFNTYYSKKLSQSIKPILLQTSYFLDSEDYKIQKVLNRIVDYGFNNTSKNHYFRSFDYVMKSICQLFEKEEDGLLLFLESCQNTQELFNSVEFSIRLKNLYLPKYELDEFQSKLYNDEDEFLLSLVSEGMLRNGLETKPEYWDRVEEEFQVIKEGGFVSYFLILYDIINYCKSKDIWWGVGRGSAGGCLIAYLLEITQIDPLQYDLLFERFLNRGRLKKGLPDIDFDVQGTRRDEVKQFMGDKYGHDRIASIGTYQTLKIRAAIKDISRQFGLEPQYMNYISSLIDSSWSFSEFIKNSLQIPQLTSFLQKNQDVVELIPLCFGQCKNTSIHAAGVVLTPKYKSDNRVVNINSWLPVRESDGNIVTEWEGSLLDDIGFLKNDILGISQLDKFKSIHQLILKNTGKDVRFKNIELKDSKVFEYFQKGLNEDIFQLGASGLKSYSIELKPEKIEDLIAIVALYRPGPIFVGTHKKYIKLKNNEEEVHYHWGCEEITKETYGLIVYQEQAIRICQVVGGFDLVTADEVRKAMGKMIRELLEKFEVKFIEGAISKGCPRDEAQIIWDEMSRFAEYSFNKSHAACYAITGYYSQWYKVHYPLEFWVTSLQMSTSDELSRRVSEINNHSSIQLIAPDINKSTTTFEYDINENKIFWSLNSIKWVSVKVLEHLFEVRQEGGLFFSFSEFLSRVQKRIVNKRVITNLILSGAFDSFNDRNIETYQYRFELLKSFYLENRYPIEEIEEFSRYKFYEWVLKQKELSSYGFINYRKVFQVTDISNKYSYLDFDTLSSTHLIDEKVSVIGLVVDLIVRQSKKGPFIQVELDINSDRFYCTLWNETYIEYKELLESSLNKIICITGNLIVDNYKKCNVLHSNNNSFIELL